ncbi:hypothetical protein [Streptomyces sp. NPDC056690]|uniref:hypothetical protein n=1 Tax=unclassified Streptomyces TaxID=2593676 RepID=UPI0036402558
MPSGGVGMKGSAHFLKAGFGSRVIFARADFGDEPVVFDGATFTGMTFFYGAVLNSGVSFEAARALAEFNQNWGSVRQWPQQWPQEWTERHLTRRGAHAAPGAEAQPLA